MERLKQPIDIVYRDEDWFIINKPYDCSIQNYSNRSDPSVESILKEQFPEITKFRNVHQLDYATSGIFVLALNKKAAAVASKLFSERKVKKTYLAILNGHLRNDSYFIEQPIAEDPNHDFRMKISSTGKPAQTLIQVIQRGQYQYKDKETGTEKTIPVTKVSLSPITGRRHQLRLHTKFIGHPIVGDYNYEEDYTATFRMMLHAHQIIFPLPETEELKATANDPFINLIK
ncbi:pseudouridine synthase [Cokeromyces recurvatus]|uniref:pseudouridine synthase n=1 Tax=Cokeromyces recurvatus TaxID=90255 RepID=UPI00221EE114|nr:pseudouridine synthase [Cokeromyces recurvatus]KAI7904360.1 pseudouridine synthase [Cokeromyces recurvatus]